MIELTNIDIFSLDKLPDPSKLTVLGIKLRANFKELAGCLNLSVGELKKKLIKQDKNSFLEIEPGFKIRITRRLFCRKAYAFVFSQPFRQRLQGIFSELFQQIQSEEQFYSFIMEHLPEPDEYSTTPPVIGFETNSFIYKAGYEFTRFETPNETSLVVTIRVN